MVALLYRRLADFVRRFVLPSLRGTIPPVFSADVGAARALPVPESRRDHTSGRARPSASLDPAQGTVCWASPLREEQSLVSGFSQNDRRGLLGGLGGGRLSVFGLGVPSTRCLVDR